ncbi:unnamed protein product [Nezara viridula]|uniref:Uncharacterized protein n=1 Tax=Nezara viridula TaxID=85310 RepID=A0A9P0HKJ2_NEZVI|nr:unnamed protein product [Nezara viridula]
MNITQKQTEAAGSPPVV